MGGIMNEETVSRIKEYNATLAQKLLDGKVVSDNGRSLNEGGIFTVSSDEYRNYLILTGFDEYWPDKFITFMEYKLKTYVTTVFKWEGGRGEDSLLDRTDDMMEQVYKRIKQYG